MAAPGERAAASSIVVILLAVALGGCGTLAAGLGGGAGDSLALAAPAGTLVESDRPGQAETSGDQALTATEPRASAGALAAVATADPGTQPEAMAAGRPDEPVPGPGDLVLLAHRPDPSETVALAEAAGRAPLVEAAAADASDQAAGPLLAQAGGRSPDAAEGAVEEYDPLEGFNEAMFAFNYRVDRYVIKPVAKAYDFVVPKDLQQMISNGFDNINVVPRVINSLLQGKWEGAGREVVRFLINSIAGIGGLWDIAKQEFNIPKSDEDFGQTLAVWGSGPGAYLVLPFLPPMTIRDGIGRAVDGAMDPLSYFLPFIWDRLAMKVGDTINERSLNLEFFEGVEETTVDLYTAVRNAYLQRRAQKIKE